MTYRPIPLAFQRVAPAEMIARARGYADAMARRRTVRDFSSEPIPDEVLVDAVRAAATAPSGAHQQPWTFVVVTDVAIKRQIREAAELEEKKSWEGRMSPEWLAALEPLGLDWHKPHLTDAPALIVVFSQPWGVDASGPEPRKIKHYYVDESVGIAVGMLLSALHLAGLATLTHTPSPMGFLREVLGRPANERAYVVIPVGFPADDAQVPDLDRKPLAEVLVRR
ncbi:MAG: nitroreductase family protein [Kofleriaceae bacterium]